MSSLFQKFFGTVRQGAGSNEHPDCNSFMQIYKILSIYSAIKPPKQGNCTINEDENNYKMLVTLEELKQIYKKDDTTYQKNFEKIKRMLDEMIQKTEGDEDTEFLTSDHMAYCLKMEKGDALIDHDYCKTPVFDCVLYFLTGDS